MKTTILRRIAVAALLAAFAATPLAFAQNKDNDKQAGVAGTWNVTVKGPAAHGDMTAALALAQNGKKVTGTLTAHGNERKVEGEFVDGSLTLATVDGDSQHQVQLNGKMKEDQTLEGYLSGPGGDMRWTAVRSGK
jgi:hypothetical protein